MSTMSAAPIIRTAWPSGSIAFLAISDPDLRHGNRVHIWNLAGSLAYYSVVLSVAVKMSVLFLMANTNLTHFSPPFGQEIVCRRRKIPA